MSPYLRKPPWPETTVKANLFLKDWLCVCKMNKQTNKTKCWRTQQNLSTDGHDAVMWVLVREERWETIPDDWKKRSRQIARKKNQVTINGWNLNLRENTQNWDMIMLKFIWYLMLEITTSFKNYQHLLLQKMRKVNLYIYNNIMIIIYI